MSKPQSKRVRGEDRGVLYLMCGLAFSGKTTLARAIVEFREATYVGLDEINRERGVGSGGAGLPVEQWERTHELAIGRVEQLMRERPVILVDDTSNLRFLRDRFRAVAERHGYDVVLVYVDTSLEEIHRRMRENARHESRAPVHPQVLDEHVRTFEHPGEDEHAVVFTADRTVDEWLRARLGAMGAAPSS